VTTKVKATVIELKAVPPTQQKRGRAAQEVRLDSIPRAVVLAGLRQLTCREEPDSAVRSRSVVEAAAVKKRSRRRGCIAQAREVQAESAAG
jgi:hypothetical protein